MLILKLHSSCWSVSTESILVQSAKTNLNVEEVFFSIARDIKQRLADTDSKSEVLFWTFLLVIMGCIVIFFLNPFLIPFYLIKCKTSLMYFIFRSLLSCMLSLTKKPSLGWILSCSPLSFSFRSLQPQTIKINQQDQGAGAAQAAQKSACCGS